MPDRPLSDENIPAGAIDALRDAGCDVLSIREIAPGIADAEVLRLAVNQSRLLVTFDRELPLTATGKPQKFVMRDKMIQEFKLTLARTA